MEPCLAFCPAKPPKKSRGYSPQWVQPKYTTTIFNAWFVLVLVQVLSRINNMNINISGSSFTASGSLIYVLTQQLDTREGLAEQQPDSEKNKLGRKEATLANPTLICITKRPETPECWPGNRPVRVFILFFLLSGLFCCLGFSGAFFLLFGRGRVFCFCCLGGGPGPAQTAKKNTPPPKQQKKKRHRPFRACFFLLFGRVGVFIFLLFGRGRVFWGMFFFCCLGGGVFFFLLFGPGASCFFCCLGGGRELTHLPVCRARL